MGITDILDNIFRPLEKFSDMSYSKGYMYIAIAILVALFIFLFVWK